MRPYIGVQLEAIVKVPSAARSALLTEHQFGWGLILLWRWCWEEKTDIVTAQVIGGHFGGKGDEVAASLVIFGFAEKLDVDSFRIRGATKYLRISEAQSVAGAKRAGAASRNGKGRFLSENTTSSHPAMAGVATSSAPAFSSKVEDRRSKKKETTVELPSEAETPTSLAVFAYWVKAMAKKPSVVFDAKRRAKVEARLRDGYTLEALCLAIDGCARTPFNMGQNDRGERYDDLELICRDAAHVDRFSANADKGSLPSGPTAVTKTKPTMYLWSDGTESTYPENFSQPVVRP